MICFLRFLCLSISLLSTLLAQEVIYSEEFGLKKKIAPGQVLARLGDDIVSPAFSTVVLDGSGSLPQNGSLTYEWSFPPDMMISDDYNFSESDSPVFYESNSGGKQSLKSLTTRNKYIEFDVPNLPGQAYQVILKVQNHVGTSDQDTLIVTVEQQLVLGETNNFSDAEQIIGDDGNISLIDESTNLREPLVETLLYSDLLSIQAINKNDLNPMEVHVINSFIYDFLKGRGLENILDPNRKIPAEISINKPYNLTRIETDTIATTYLDTVSSGEDLSGFTTEPVDTVYKSFTVNDTTTSKKTYYVYRLYQNEVSIDTLTYTEVIDTTLQYKFNCKNYDCASENAYLERAGRVLSWGINQYDQLEFHYFSLEDIYDSEPMGKWIADPIIFNPITDSILRYPEYIAFDSSGSSIVISGNRQEILKLENNLKPISALKNLPEGHSVEFPSGLCVGPLGELYITDQSNHSIFWVYEGVTSTVYSAPRYDNGDLIEGEPTMPTSIQLNSFEEIVVLFLGDGSVRKFDRKGQQQILLQPGVILAPSDIALNNKDTLFIVSEVDKKVYKVIKDDEVIVVAGTDGSLSTASDGVLATDSFLGAPVSIDFDLLNRLYIADNLFGSIRVVNTDGIISTLNEKNNRVFNIKQMRVNNHDLTTVYASHPLQHKITRLRFQSYAQNSAIESIEYPYFILEKEGVYGLEVPIKSAVELVMGKSVPKEKTSVFRRLSKTKKDFLMYLKNRPILIGVLLILLNQGISEVLSDEVLDTPPGFPPL